MANRIRNRVINQKIEDVQTHFQEYRPVYLAGAVGFLCGGFIVLAFSHRAQVRVTVNIPTVNREIWELSQ